MAFDAFTQVWMDEFKKAIQADAEYPSLAHDWEGSVSIIVNADASKNVPDPKYLFMDFWHGEVKDFLVCDKAKAEGATFVMSGDYARWKQVAKKEIDPTKALMQGKLKLKGDLTYVVRRVKTVNKVVDCLTRVDTKFPDE
ncbi:MAG: SCP2 sterol-binding domain-containing protein [Smithellaceae bacterium]|nr:SCP2 sterol-binding domain-containing protein [Smithellaceae bacterium]